MNIFNGYAVAVAIALAYPMSIAAQDSAQPRPAKVAAVKATSNVVRRSYPAAVLPSREVQLSFRVSGRIVELPVRAASRVAEGDVIAKLDLRDFENQIAQLQSQKTQSAAQLQALRAGARPEELSALEASVEAAEAQFDQALDTVERTRELVQRGVSTNAQLEVAEANFRVAEANLRAQEEQLRIGVTGGRPEEIAAAEAVVEGIDVQLRIAQDNLNDATLRAPFSGVIARRDVDNFTNVTAGQEIALLQALDVVHLAFDIPGPDVTSLSREGPGTLTITAEFSALPGTTFATEIVEFALQPDSITQTYRGRVAVDVPQGAIILPGMVATVTAVTPGTGSQLTIPLTAIAAAPDGGALVWRVDDAGRVTGQPVTLGTASGASVSVVEGVSEGDMVVTAGVSQLIEGMTIRPIAQIGD